MADKLVQEMYKRMFGNGSEGNYIPRTFKKTVGGVGAAMVGGPKKRRKVKYIPGSMPHAVEQDKKAGRY